jgi:hypothetical protein
MTKFEIATILVALLRTAMPLFIHFDLKKEQSNTNGKTRSKSNKKPR